MGKHWFGKPRTVEVGISSVSAGNSIEVPVFAAPFKCRLKKFSIVPASNITGASTNYMTLGFKNKGTDGSGTTVLASRAFTSGVNATGFDETIIGTSNVDLMPGTVISFYKSESGSGMAMPNLLAKIEFERL